MAGLLEVVIPAASGIVGVLVGGWVSGRAQERQHERDRAAEMSREARARSISAAERCDPRFQQLAELIPKVANIRTPPKEMREASDTEHRLYGELEDDLVFLPSPYRERLERDASLMRHADELGSDGYRRIHYHSIRTVTRTVASDAHAVLASFLRNQSIPDENEYVVEYQSANDLLMADKEDEYGEEIFEAEQQRKAWRQKNMPGEPNQSKT